MIETSMTDPAEGREVGTPDGMSSSRKLSPVDRAISDMLQGLSEEESKHLLSLGRVIDCQAGDMLIRAGEPGGELFLVLTGTLMQATEPSQKLVDAPSLFLRGDVVGEVPFLATGIRQFSVCALEDSRLLVLSHTVIDELVEGEPRLAAKIFRNLARVVAARFLHEIGFSVTKTITASTPLVDLKSDLANPTAASPERGAEPASI
jgi:signal-transduction protein with cAMP-binding, CBS, and nucleotidyltransferase domain